MMISPCYIQGIQWHLCIDGWVSIIDLNRAFSITINTITSNSIIHLLIYTSWSLSDHPDELLKCDQGKYQQISSTVQKWLSM